MIVRAERREDFAAVSEVLEGAFGRTDEAALVEGLRANPTDFVPELSLVVEDEGAVVGHVLFSRVRLDPPAPDLQLLALAPLAVHPNHQRRGVGTALVREGVSLARSRNFGAVIVLGHPEYYARFGFTTARPLGIEPPFDVPDAAWMALELQPGVLTGIHGTIRYPPEFGLV